MNIPHADLATQLKQSLWVAYGGPIKLVATIVVCCMLAGAIYGFIRKCVR